MSLSVAVTHRFPGFSLDVAFEAPPGVTALFGRSGSGKTTLVNAVAGLIRPDTARIAVNDTVLHDSAAGVWLAPHKRRIGYVFQEGRLFPHLSVSANLAYGGWFAPRGAVEPGERERVVAMLGLGALLDRRPATLSGGEKQRVAIGRALLSAPRLLLMDEPLAALDDARKAEILPYLERLRDETDIPVLYVSHSVTEVARLATTVVSLSDGRTTRVGSPAEVLADPRAVPTLGIRDAGAMVSAVIRRHADDGLSELDGPGGPLLLPRIAAPEGTRVRVRIHAHDVILAREAPAGISALNVLKVTVAAVRAGEGPGMVVQLDAGGERLLARITRRSARALEIAPGLACYAILKSVAIAPEDIWIASGEETGAS
ncbi:molybdenum ABC transporter ATP-binding protein [Stappia stellulata]|uniref:molybdenum ABC transporter ATP-binding protein n=1 Tax=Stappia stellulata TaxID=71235 RepID=UPI001CD27BEB|nr:molybdenum ABC transporter ATP-binding protein [Stappia stellulata]MCA1243268.1 molybdenum ABC transporter ATP-binding protein [Stappia stellulata]